MKTTIHGTARAGSPVNGAGRAREAARNAANAAACDDAGHFLGSRGDAVEHDSIVREFETARDEALSAERYN
jgi:hypothetical protein